MSTKRMRCTDPIVHNSKGANHCSPQAQREDNNDFLSASHIKLMEEFIQFFKTKISNQANKLNRDSNKNINAIKEAAVHSYNFKEKLVLQFGKYLPGKVIDELCALVHANSHGKCNYCALPTESLVLGVLQILLDAGSKIGETDKNVHVSKTKISTSSKDPIKLVKKRGRPEALVDEVIDVDAIPNKDFISHEYLRRNAKAPSNMNALSDKMYNIKNLPASTRKEDVHQRREQSVVHEPTVIGTKAFNQIKRNPQISSQFHGSDEERRYYEIICGLAHSQWKCFPAIKFGKTSVTYQSLGESVESGGLVDNFFIAGFCRKMFEDHHPRHSRKHYFYPTVGGCLLTYNCEYDKVVVKNSFVGTNSAHKLHKCQKLCFPVWNNQHWFVFIVDLPNKLFVFLDSLFNRDDKFQICVQDRLITTFKECWYEHADVKLDLEDFSTRYPAVPKQQNFHDCGIFAIKFMEMWDNNLDMTMLFSQSDIPNIRIKLATSLFFTASNSVDMSLVNKFYDEGINPRICN